MSNKKYIYYELTEDKEVVHSSYPPKNGINNRVGYAVCDNGTYISTVLNSFIQFRVK